MNYIETIELYPLNRQIVWYVNYISSKLLQKKRTQKLGLLLFFLFYLKSKWIAILFLKIKIICGLYHVFFFLSPSPFLLFFFSLSFPYFPLDKYPPPLSLRRFCGLDPARILVWTHGQYPASGMFQPLATELSSRMHTQSESTLRLLLELWGKRGFPSSGIAQL